MKLFLREDKQNPILFKGERRLNDFLAFLAQKCKSSTPGKSIMQAQFASYAANHKLAQKLRPSLVKLMETIRGQNLEAAAKLPPSHGFTPCPISGCCGDHWAEALLNWERHLVGFLSDPYARTEAPRPMLRAIRSDAQRSDPSKGMHDLANPHKTSNPSPDEPPIAADCRRYAHGLPEFEDKVVDDDAGGGASALDELTVLRERMQREWQSEHLCIEPGAFGLGPIRPVLLTDTILNHVEQLLTGSFPPDPMRIICERLIGGVLPVWVRSIPKLFNAPRRWVDEFLSGRMPRWKKESHVAEMSTAEQARSC